MWTQSKKDGRLTCKSTSSASCAGKVMDFESHCLEPLVTSIPYFKMHMICCWQMVKPHKTWKLKVLDEYTQQSQPPEPLPVDESVSSQRENSPLQDVNSPAASPYFDPHRITIYSFLAEIYWKDRWWIWFRGRYCKDDVLGAVKGGHKCETSGLRFRRYMTGLFPNGIVLCTIHTYIYIYIYICIYICMCVCVCVCV